MLVSSRLAKQASVWQQSPPDITSLIKWPACQSSASHSGSSESSTCGVKQAVHKHGANIQELFCPVSVTVESGRPALGHHESVFLFHMHNVW